MRFLLKILISRSLFSHLRYSFLVFFFLISTELFSFSSSWLFSLFYSFESFFYSLGFFCTSFNLWSFTEFCVAASLLKFSEVSILPLLINHFNPLTKPFGTVLISNSSKVFTKPLQTIPNKPITIGITINLMFHSFFSSLARSKYLHIFLLSVTFNLWPAGTAKSMWWQVLFFTISGLLDWIRWSICISKS